MRLLAFAAAAARAGGAHAADAAGEESPEARLRPRVEEPLPIRMSAAGLAALEERPDVTLRHRELSLRGGLPLYTTDDLTLAPVAGYSLRWVEAQGAGV